MQSRHLVGLLFLTGCSFAFVRGPGSVGPAACTRGYWLPATDIVVLTPTITVLGVVGAVGCGMGGGSHCAAQTLASAGMIAASVASGIYGIVAVKHCRATPEEHGPPPPPPRDVACEERRAELRQAALAEPDLGKRTKMLQALPSCSGEQHAP